MIGLIRNENMKIYSRKFTWILLILIVIITTSTFILNKINDKDVEDWRVKTTQDIETYKGRLQYTDLHPMLISDVENKLKIAEYRLENNIPPAPNNVWTSMLNYSGLVEMAIIFSIAIAASMVAGEYSSGTMKFLLIRPHSRSKILFSKYIAVTIFAILMLVLLVGSGYITNIFLYGTGGINSSDLFINQQGQIVQYNVMMQVVKMYGLSIFPIMAYVTLAFTISTALRNSALAIGISLITMIIGNSMIEATSKISWLKYLPFANSDISMYIFHLPARPEMTLGFSISILIFYIFILSLISWTIFIKRDAVDVNIVDALILN